jgi:hypothetical protein
MDWNKLIANPAFYQAANPSTTPEDYDLIRRAVALLPESPSVVRLHDAPKPIASGQVKFGVPEIRLFRHGKVYKTHDPMKIAGTLLHEQTHLNETGQRNTEAEYEVSAREKQLQFLKDAMRRGEFSDKGYVSYMEKFLRHYQRQKELEQSDPLRARRAKLPGGNEIDREAMLALMKQ